MQRRTEAQQKKDEAQGRQEPNPDARRSAKAMQQHIQGAGKRMLPGILDAASALLKGDLAAADEQLTSALGKVVQAPSARGMADASTAEANTADNFATQLNALAITFAKDLLVSTAKADAAKEEKKKSSGVSMPTPSGTRTRGDSVD